MRSSVHERHETPHGRLHLSCVTAFGNECLAPAVPKFARRFPQLDVSIELGIGWSISLESVSMSPSG
ncbi:LysR substrate-binding domain-containing protein [Shinella kummerowiae]|jgi:DNA-binding transcriptional LysR family regulator|uniref:LysR substrate-binding domain-containing protein n=1 Tax=Shinella kummerowiae TaxID=417745 RepID=UPI003B8495B5